MFKNILSGFLSLQADKSKLSKTNNHNLPAEYFTFQNNDLLYFSDKNPDKISFGMSLGIKISILDDEINFDTINSDDPSTIFIKLPIQKPLLNEQVEALGYYPSYSGLNPRQRWIYLNWLQDVSKTIEIGYVFIYYYGLERQLLIGNYELAFDEIIKLRQYHRTPSFLSYSQSALFNSSLIKKRMDKLEILAKNEIGYDFNDVFFMIAYKMKYNLSVNNLMLIFRQMPGLNKRYFKEDNEKFRELLSQILIDKYKEPMFPFPRNYRIEEMTTSRYPLFANISLPDDIRAPNLPDFYRYTPLLNDLKAIFMLTHGKYKELKQEERKKKRKCASIKL